MLPSDAARPPFVRRVLVFEENERLRTVAAMALMRAGYEVDEATDEVTAELLLSQRVRTYAVLVVGLNASGEGAGERLASRAEAARPAIAIVAWSDGQRPELARRIIWLRRSWLSDDLLAAVSLAVAGPTSRPPARRDEADRRRR